MSKQRLILLILALLLKVHLATACIKFLGNILFNLFNLKSTR
jgi:hypothetical protein